MNHSSIITLNYLWLQIILKQMCRWIVFKKCRWVVFNCVDELSPKTVSMSCLVDELSRFLQNEQPGTAKICVVFVTRPFIAQTTAINSISFCPTRIAMPAVHIHLTFFSELFCNSMKAEKIAKHLSTATYDTAQKYRTATFSLTERRLALTRNK